MTRTSTTVGSDSQERMAVIIDLEQRTWFSLLPLRSTSSDPNVSIIPRFLCARFTSRFSYPFLPFLAAILSPCRTLSIAELHHRKPRSLPYRLVDFVPSPIPSLPYTLAITPLLLFLPFRPILNLSAPQRLTGGGTDIAINWAGGLHDATHRFSDAPDALKSCASSASACSSTSESSFRHDDTGSQAAAGAAEECGYATRAGSGAILLSDPPVKLAFDPSLAFDSGLNPPPPFIVNTAFYLRVRRTPGCWVAHSSPLGSTGWVDADRVLSTGAGSPLRAFGRGGWVPAQRPPRRCQRAYHAAPSTNLPNPQPSSPVLRPPSPLHVKSTLRYCVGPSVGGYRPVSSRYWGIATVSILRRTVFPLGTWVER
ncbi:hypothetical protein C8F01DRAFT_1266578 [Mycena amicta]|nr:hypothetical protein C8F01DRAFT_1266578 [Mycena amicta]